MKRHTLLPQAPDRAQDIAFEGADGLAFGLALAQAARHILLGGRPTADLGEGDPIEDRVEPAVATPIQAVADAPSRGGFQGSGAGMGAQWGLTREAPPGAQDAGGGTRREQL